MLSLRDVRLRRGPRVLFDKASLTVFRGDKVGIVGRNGSGKSSLLSLVRGELTPDLGDYDAPTNQRIATVAQELPETRMPVVEYVREGDEELVALEQELARANTAGDGEREAMLYGDYEAAGGYRARSHAASLATGLGFDAADIERPLAEFSGGLRMRASLARALMRRSDILILDEPTNHLDLDAVLWLEGWLRAYRGTLLVVSHDREFLDRIVGRVVHIENSKVAAYTGNYSDFERQYAAARERDAALAARQKREIEHVQSFVARFRAKASKARQAQSRLKWLARLPEVVAAHDEESFEWEFAAPAKLPRPLVTVEKLAAGYGTRTIVDEVTLSLAPGDRLGVLGRNGAGKSTLMRTIAGELPTLGGDRTAAPDLEIGFFAQAEMEQLDASASSVLELTRRGGPLVARWGDQQKRDHLGGFGFRGNRVFEPIHTFSGGERARLTLAILVARRPNLLLLDEPTNHLDFEMRTSLLLALQDFAGAVVLVSHDRSLLRGVCDEFVIVGHGKAVRFDGDLEDYAAWLARSGAAPKDEASRSSKPAAKSATRPAAESAAGSATRSAVAPAAKRKGASPLAAQIREIEARLASLGAERDDLERSLADPALYAAASGGGTTAQEAPTQRNMASRLAVITRTIDEEETRWLDLSAQLDALQQA